MLRIVWWGLSRDIPDLNRLAQSLMLLLIIFLSKDKQTHMHLKFMENGSVVVLATRPMESECVICLTSLSHCQKSLLAEPQQNDDLDIVQESHVSMTCLRTSCIQKNLLPNIN